MNSGAIFLGGVNGSGKSEFLTRLQSARGNWGVVQGSDALMKWLHIPPGDYESLRKVPREQTIKEYGALVCHEIKRNLAREHPLTLVFDSHYLNLVEGRIYSSVGGNWLSAFAALVLLWAEPQTILERLTKTPNRDRRLFPKGLSRQRTLECLEDYTARTRLEFYRLANDFSLPHIIIRNENGQLDFAVEQFIAFHGSRLQDRI